MGELQRTFTIINCYCTYSRCSIQCVNWVFSNRWFRICKFANWIDLDTGNVQCFGIGVGERVNELYKRICHFIGSAKSMFCDERWRWVKILCETTNGDVTVRCTQHTRVNRSCELMKRSSCECIERFMALAVFFFGRERDGIDRNEDKKTYQIHCVVSPSSESNNKNCVLIWNDGESCACSMVHLMMCYTTNSCERMRVLKTPRATTIKKQNIQIVN